MKETMMQFFDWYSRNDGWHWNRLKKNAAYMKRLGITQVWMPPAYKGCGGKNDVGYGVYDMYDLGEFDQKGTVRTKYGTKDQYIAAIAALKKRGIKPLADIVFNHKMGADELETLNATELDFNDRSKEISDLHEIQAWTRYTYPGRGDTYSNYIWNWTCFTGTDYDVKAQKHGLFQFEGKVFDPYVSKELGNFDYIMGNDVDFRCTWVIEELIRWGKWYLDMTQVEGFRLDAIKSIDSRFFDPWLKEMERYANRKLFAVGEYWSGDLKILEQYLEDCSHCMKLFDVPLHFHFYDVSRSNGNYDVRKIFYNTLSASQPEYAVAFVDNHDTQPEQALESWVQDWFKVSAYACILLYKCQNPCIFYGDTNGIRHSRIKPVPYLEEMVWIRSHILSDTVNDCFDDDYQKCCWVASGKHPVCVLFSIGEAKERWVWLPENKGEELIDITNPKDHVTIDENGDVRLTCQAGSCSIYILKADYKKMRRVVK